VVEPPEHPQHRDEGAGEDTIATGSANGRAGDDVPPGPVAGESPRSPVQQRKQAPKTGYSADNPFVPEWEQQAAGEQAAKGIGASNVPQDLEQNTADERTRRENTATPRRQHGGTNQALSNGVAVPAVYPYALRVSSAETMGDLARSVRRWAERSSTRAVRGSTLRRSRRETSPRSFARS
jgi:hypothetical protein